MESNKADNKLMEEGISQLLGYTPYKSVPALDKCVHEDDGFIYDDTHTKITLHCQLCGEFYDEKK